MKYAIASLIFFICLPFCLAKEAAPRSTDEICSYAAQGVHTVPEYRKLLTRLRGDSSKKTIYKKRKRKRSHRGTGQR